MGLWRIIDDLYLFHSFDFCSIYTKDPIFDTIRPMDIEIWLIPIRKVNFAKMALVRLLYYSERYIVRSELQQNWVKVLKHKNNLIGFNCSIFEYWIPIIIWLIFCSLRPSLSFYISLINFLISDCRLDLHFKQNQVLNNRVDISVPGTDITCALFPYQALCACAMRWPFQGSPPCLCPRFVSASTGQQEPLRVEHMYYAWK